MPKPVLPSHDSASYELLSLTALCGEFPCDSAARLISSESYRKKIVTGLTHNRLLRIFSRNHLRGYRLGIRGKRLLQDQEPERFLFYLSGCGDTNAIKSEPSRRLRLHRIARTYITMKNAGITIFRDKKPPLFSHETAGAIPIEDVYFYDSREMKELRSEMLKIYGSRMTGALFTPKQAFLVRMTEVNKTPQEELSVHADIKSVTENTSREALKRCRVQSKYAGRVTDVHKGIVYVRLSNGVNAVAHSCYDRRTPGKKDDVSFVVTKLDEERSIAVGIITRIIRQNL